MSIELSQDILESVSLYPDIEDSNFNIKIAQKEEFNRTKKDKVEFDDIEQFANDLPCEFTELLPHQIFVKNFLSFTTPYNSLLLYHGLGSGKTCSAIGVAEVMRVYLKNLGISSKIMIVATPNIQDNFKKQLFNENKLKNTKGQWYLNSCVGNNLLKEIRANHLSSKKTIISQINKLIDDGYEFLGYTKLSHLIEQKKSEKKLNSYFENRLIIIDEVHNIRVNDDIENKKIANNLFYLVKKIKSIRFLLLSATPMFNSYKEILWIINLMNLNDNRPSIEEKEIFDKNGDFLVNIETGEEVGKKLFVRKVTGYISFVRGENPFTFPYRIFPYQFDTDNSFLNEGVIYPRIQFNGQSIIQQLEHVDVYKIGVGNYQKQVYLKIINSLLSKKGTELEEENKTEKLGYNKMQIPLESLNIVFPIHDIEDADLELTDENLNEFVGKEGLNKLIENVDKFPYKFNDSYTDDSNRSIFSFENIQKYSYKIHSIINSILSTDGIVLVYSQYLYGGLIPLALALEELGFSRFTKKHTLLSDDYKAKHRIRSKKSFNDSKLSYAMITGATATISSKNAEEIKNAVKAENIDGDVIKVILISRAGSEGIDLKNVRSIHIMEPWYNMNRIEQIIGRGVRNCSHRALPYIKRNVSIYLYGTVIEEEDNNYEGIDLYLYRISELKALKIGAVSRVLKETSIDCLLSTENNNLSIHKLNTETDQVLSNQKKIKIQVGDKPFSSLCDYMESCSYKCLTYDKNINDIKYTDIDDTIDNDTLSQQHNLNNINQLIYNIKILFTEKHFYYYEDIYNRLTHFTKYSHDEIKSALNILTSDSNEEIVDIYQRVGNIVNHGEIYFFQPKEITNKNISLLERSTPIDYKQHSLELLIDDNDGDDDGDVKSTNKELSSSTKQEVLKGDETIYSEFIRSVQIFKNSREFTVPLNLIETSSNPNKQLIIDSLNNTIAYHYVYDKLSYEKRYEILQLLDNDSIDTGVLNDYIYQYKFEYDDETYLLFPKNEEILLFEKTRNKWEETSSFMQKETATTITSTFTNELKDMIEYLGVHLYKYKKSNLEHLFKIKETYNLRASGTVCKLKYKNDLLQIIQTTFNEYNFKDMNITISQTIHICSLMELLYRLYHHEKKDNKIWFLSPTSVNIYKKFNTSIKL